MGPRGIFALALVTCVWEVVDHAAQLTGAMHIAAGPGWPLLVFAAGLVVVLNVDRVTARGRLARIAGVLGLATYPLYLIHQAAGAVVMAALLDAGVMFPSALALTVIAVFAAALLCTLYAEPYVRGHLAGAIERLAAFRLCLRPALRRG